MAHQIRFKIPVLATTRHPDISGARSRSRSSANAHSADPFRRMRKVLALAQARKVDVILVTELIRWGRSARFAARSYRQNPNLLRLGANVDLRLDAIGPAF